MKRWLIGILAGAMLCALCDPAAAAPRARAFTAPAGGGFGAMDKVSRTVLSDGEIGLVANGNRFSVYVYDAASTEAESGSAPYRYVRPDDYAGAGVWRLCEAWPLRHDQAVAAGTIIYYDGAKWVSLAIGSAGQVLTVSSGLPAWMEPTGGSGGYSGTDITWGVSSDATHTWTWDTGAGTDPTLAVSDAGFAFGKTVTVPAIESSAGDGGHFANIGNSGDFTGTKAEGDLWWNKTDDVLKVYDGAVSVVVAKKIVPVFELCIANPTSSHTKIKKKLPRAVVLTAVHAKCEGGTNVVGRLYEVDPDGDDSDKVGIDSADWTITTTAFSDTSFTNASLDANDWLQWDTTSVSGSVTSFCVNAWGYEQ